jgi:hypothetical protein
MIRYRFLDGMGEEIEQREFADHQTALTWAVDDFEDADGIAEDGIQRVEYLGPEGDWRWAGPLSG